MAMAQPKHLLGRQERPTILQLTTAEGCTCVDIPWELPPISLLNTRLNELSDPYPTAEATSENDILFERIMAPALYMRHCVRYSRGVWPKTILNFKAKADLDMLAW